MNTKKTIKANSSTLNVNNTTVIGDMNTIYGDDNIIIGNMCVGHGNRLKFKGNMNTSHGDDCEHDGSMNTYRSGNNSKKPSAPTKKKVSHNVSYGDSSIGVVTGNVTINDDGVFIQDQDRVNRREAEVFVTNRNGDKMRYNSGNPQVIPNPNANFGGSFSGTFFAPVNIIQGDQVQAKKPRIEEEKKGIVVDPKIKTSERVKHKEGSSEKECVVCFENSIRTIFLDCGHVVTCQDCALEIASKQESNCPVCRNPIKEIKLFQYS